MRKLVIVSSSIAAIIFAIWLILFAGTPMTGPHLSLKNSPILSIDLNWFNTNGTISASNQCAAVATMMGKARKCEVPASPPFGSLTIHYTDGSTSRFFLQPSGRFGGMEFADETGGYGIRMGDALETFRTAGLFPKDR